MYATGRLLVFTYRFIPAPSSILIRTLKIQKNNFVQHNIIGRLEQMRTSTYLAKEAVSARER